MLVYIPLTFLLIIEDQARRTLFKTGTASVASKKTELGGSGGHSPSGGVRGQSPLQNFLGVLDALS